MPKIDVTGLTRIGQRIDRIKTADFEPLVVRWAKVIQDDNRKGILAGLDRFGQPLPPVKYRPILTSALIVKSIQGKDLVVNRKKDRGFKGFGPQASGLHGNLTSAQYRRLAGPPTAPRGANSRVITNLALRHGRESGRWFAEGAWLDVVTVKGEPFLKYLLGRFDIAGVRPDGRALAQQQLYDYVLKIAKRRGS